ncbi:MAG: metal-dependent hydrolase [Vicinamibacterales bacterium]
MRPAPYGIIEEMPSPVGHALGGVIVGSLALRRPGWWILTACAIAAALPDLDLLLPVTHRGPTHSLTAAACAFGLAWLVVRSRRDSIDTRTAAALGLAVLSHVLFDWLGEDSSTPRGVMALWPFSHAFYVSDLNVFAAADRRYWLPGVWRRNLFALAREILILGPLTWLVMKRRAGR